MAGGDARLAAGACVEVDLESVLLSRRGPVERDQVAVVPGLRRKGVRLMALPISAEQVYAGLQAKAGEH